MFVARNSPTRHYSQVVSQQLFVVRLAPSTLTKLGELFRCLCSKAPEAFARHVVRAGHIKAGWGRWDGSVNFQAMLENYQFYREKTYSDHELADFEVKGDALAEIAWKHCQIPEKFFDAEEYRIPMTQQEQTKAAKENSKPRDQMSLVFRRACIMLTEEFAAAQKAEVEAAEKAKKDAEQAKEEQMRNKHAKLEQQRKKEAQKELMTKQKLDEEVRRATALQKSLARGRESLVNADDWRCAICAMLWSEADEAGLVEKRSAWKQCAKTYKTKGGGKCVCVVSWCTDCMKTSGSLRLIEAHNSTCLAYDSDKQPTNLQKKTVQKVQTELSQKDQERADVSPSTLAPTNPTELPVIPLQPNVTERPIKDLLQDTQFKEEACRLLGIDGVPEFSPKELDGAYAVAMEIKQRLKDLVESNRLTAAQKDSKVWGWAEKNCVRMLALKILSGYVDLTKGSGTGCFLIGKQVFELVPTKKMRAEIFGSYLAWDEEIGTWIRSGKAQDCTKRTLAHNKDAQDYRGSTIEIKKKTYLEFI